MLLVAAPVLNHVLGNKDVFTPLVGSSLLQERVIGPVSGGGKVVQDIVVDIYACAQAASPLHLHFVFFFLG